MIFTYIPLIVSSFTLQGISSSLSWQMFKEDCRIGYKYNRLFPLLHTLKYLFLGDSTRMYSQCYPCKIPHSSKNLAWQKKQVNFTQGVFMYLNTYPNPTFKSQAKAFLRKCYRKLQALFGQSDFVPSGHFYSPIANAKEIEEGIAHRSYDPLDLRGIDLHLEDQKKLLQNFARFYAEMPFTEEKQPHLHYYFNNQAYCHSDGICLYSMIRYLKPKRIIEVGSGFSSALMHDVRGIIFCSKFHYFSANVTHNFALLSAK